MYGMLNRIVQMGENTLLLSVVKSHHHDQLYHRDPQEIDEYLALFRAHGLRLFQAPRVKLPFSEKLLAEKRLIMSFPTPYEPLEAFKKDFNSTPSLHRMIVHYFPYKSRKNSEGRRRVLIYLHGWGRPSLMAERLWHFPSFQRAYHCDVFALELPYHMSRNPGGFSGQGLLDSDPMRTLEGFRQAIIESLVLYRHLKRWYDVGFLGVSLGGHLLIIINYLLQEDFFGIAALVGSPLKENLKKLRISPNLLKSLRNEKVSKALSILDFNKIPVKHRNSNFYLFGGKHDPIIGLHTVLNLGKHLRCPTYILPTGHFTFSFFLPFVTMKIVHWPGCEMP